MGMICNLSTNIVLMQVEKVDKEKNLIIYPQGERHQGRPPHRTHQAQHRPRRLQSARVAVHHGVGRARQDGRLLPQRRRERDLHRQLLVSDRQRRRVVEPHATASRSCSAASAATPRSWPPSSRKCWPARKSSCRAWRTATRTICISVGARWSGCKASLKLDYNEKRDFVGWGGEDFRRAQRDARLHALFRPDTRGRRRPGGQLPRHRRRRQARPAAWSAPAASPCCKNGGDSLNEVSLPGLTGGCRAAVWADYNGDGKPDLLLATPDGPKLYTNLGGNVFRDDSHLLPRQPGYNLTAAAWIDYDGDGRPDILLGNGFHGLRLYRNKGPVDQAVPLQARQVVVLRPVPEPQRPGLRGRLSAGDRAST